MADFYAARDRSVPPLPWPSIAPPFTQDIADGFVAQRVVDDWMNFYNRQRPHAALGKATPNEVYGDESKLKKAA